MGFVKGASQILLRNYFFECLGGACIPTFETLPQEVSVYSPLTIIIIRYFFLKKQDGKIAKSRKKKGIFFVQFASAPGKTSSL